MMNRMKRILKDKRGLAVENAILFMIVIFSFCTLLTSLTLSGHLHTRLDQKQLLNDIKLDQIGEDYLASLKAGQEFNNEYENYDYKVSGNTLTVWFENDINETTVLCVEAEYEADEIHILRWAYTLP